LYLFYFDRYGTNDLRDILVGRHFEVSNLHTLDKPSQKYRQYMNLQKYTSTMKLHLLLLSATLVNAAVETTPPVDLGTASSYTILAKSGISTVPTSAITGNIGVSPIASTAITSFALNLDWTTGQFSTASQILGQAHAVNYGGNVAAELTVAVVDMQAAYTDTASRTTADSSRINLLNGFIGGKTLTPGVYTFTKNTRINSDITFEGGAEDVFIIQTTGILTLAANRKMLLSSGVQAKNIFWQVARNAKIGAGASMQGVLLVFTDVLLKTGSSLIGSIMAQTAVNLEMARITQVEAECWSASDCGDTTLFTCESNECQDVPCNTLQTGVGGCGASDCGDTSLFTCESNECKDSPCNTGQTGVGCCDASDCGVHL
jgi:hypothetical protein